MATSSPTIYPISTAVEQNLTLQWTSENATTTADQSALHQGGLRWSALCLCVLIVATAFGNVLLCVAVVTERRLQNMTNYFLTSLAVADLLVSVLVMPLALLVELYGYFPLGPTVCVIWATMDVLLCTASIWHMCTMSVDRYCSLRFPLRYGRTRTRRSVIARIVFVWITSTAICVPLAALGFADHSNVYSSPGLCAPTARYFIIYGSTLAFYVPLVVMVVTYVLTVRLLRGNTRTLKDVGDDVHEGRLVREGGAEAGRGGGGEDCRGGVGGRARKMANGAWERIRKLVVDVRRGSGDVGVSSSEEERRRLERGGSDGSGSRGGESDSRKVEGKVDGLTGSSSALSPCGDGATTQISECQSTEFEPRRNGHLKVPTAAAAAAGWKKDGLLNSYAVDSYPLLPETNSNTNHSVDCGHHSTQQNPVSSQEAVRQRAIRNVSAVCRDCSLGGCSHPEHFSNVKNTELPPESTSGSRLISDARMCQSSSQSTISGVTGPTSSGNPGSFRRTGSHQKSKELLVDDDLRKIVDDRSTSGHVMAVEKCRLHASSDDDETSLDDDELLDESWWPRTDADAAATSGRHKHFCIRISPQIQPPPSASDFDVKSAEVATDGDIRLVYSPLSTDQKTNSCNNHRCCDPPSIFVISSSDNQSDRSPTAAASQTNHVVVNSDTDFSKPPTSERQPQRPSSSTSTAAVAESSSTTADPIKNNDDDQFDPSRRPLPQSTHRNLTIATRTKRGSRNERRATRVLGIMFSVFVVMWSPFFVLNLVSTACPDCAERVAAGGLGAALVWLGYVSSLANPVIYTAFSPAFRSAFGRILSCRGCSGRRGRTGGLLDGAARGRQTGAERRAIVRLLPYDATRRDRAPTVR